MTSTWQLAQAALKTGDLTKLNTCFEQIRRSSATDKYYWAYLAEHPEIFFEVAQEEHERREGIINENRVTVLTKAISLNKVRSGNISEIPIYTRKDTKSKRYLWRERGKDWFYSANMEEAQSYMRRFLWGKSWNALLKITQIPEVFVCGGFPAACIYQHWKYDWMPTDPHVIDSRTCSAPCGKVHFIKKNWDIDLFIVCQDEERILEIIKEIRHILTKYFDAVPGMETEHCIQFCPLFTDSEGGYREGWAFQIIKREYSSLDEILLGFDVDSCAAAYKDGRFYVHSRFVRAVQHGANVIIPARQSKSYAYRLSKYLNRGFTLWIPADLHRFTPNNVIRQFLERVVQRPPYCFYEKSDYMPTNPANLLFYRHSGYLKKIGGRFIEKEEDIQVEHWLSQDPGTQITSTFNPTFHNLLGGPNKYEMNLSNQRFDERELPSWVLNPSNSEEELPADLIARVQNNAEDSNVLFMGEGEYAIDLRTRFVYRMENPIVCIGKLVGNKVCSLTPLEEEQAQESMVHLKS